VGAKPLGNVSGVVARPNTSKRGIAHVYGYKQRKN
jgi:hypothetical protein